MSYNYVMVCSCNKWMSIAKNVADGIPNLVCGNCKRQLKVDDKFLAPTYIKPFGLVLNEEKKEISDVGMYPFTEKIEKKLWKLRRIN